MKEALKYVMIYGFRCKVLAEGVCADDGCGKPTVTIIDPEGNEDTVHAEDCDAE